MHFYAMAGNSRKASRNPKSKNAAKTKLARPKLSPGARRARAKFLYYFSNGFRDSQYVDWERGYKWDAHERWEQSLNSERFRQLLNDGRHADIAAIASAIEGRTNLLFSFEKMALRDAVKTPEGAHAFATGVYDLLYGTGDIATRFTRWCDVVARLPRRQTRVLTWPVVTVVGFIAQPKTHIFLKPTVTRKAAALYGARFDYRSRPAWETYASLLALARKVRGDLRDLRPRDMIDIQSFLWVQGSDEYPA